MKVNKDTFSKFVELINLASEIEIKECILRGDANSLKVLAVTPSRVLMLRGEIAGDFSELGVVGVDDVSLLKKVVGKCKADVEIVKTQNTLEITSGKLEVSLVLRNPEYILTDIDESKYKSFQDKASGNEFSLCADDVSEFANYYGIFGKEVAVNGKGNLVTFKLNSGSNKLNLKLPVTESIEEFGVKIGSLFMTVLAIIKNDVKMSMKDKAQVIEITTTIGDITFSYIVAPLVA